MMILYPANVTRDSNGLLLVTLPNLPEVAAVGEEESEALHQAAEVLEVAIGERIARRETVPPPSPIKGRKTVPLYRAKRE